MWARTGQVGRSGQCGQDRAVRRGHHEGAARARRSAAGGRSFKAVGGVTAPSSGIRLSLSHALHRPRPRPRPVPLSPTQDGGCDPRPPDRPLRCARTLPRPLPAAGSACS